MGHTVSILGLVVCSFSRKGHSEGLRRSARGPVAATRCGRGNSTAGSAAEGVFSNQLGKTYHLASAGPQTSPALGEVYPVVVRALLQRRTTGRSLLVGVGLRSPAKSSIRGVI